jgi:hypothetical protein
MDLELSLAARIQYPHRSLEQVVFGPQPSKQRLAIAQASDAFPEYRVAPAY